MKFQFHLLGGLGSHYIRELFRQTQHSQKISNLINFKFLPIFWTTVDDLTSSSTGSGLSLPLPLPFFPLPLPFPLPVLSSPPACKEQGARSKEQGARSKEQGARSKEQGAGVNDMQVKEYEYLAVKVVLC